jgi:hypothetical protein
MKKFIINAFVSNAGLRHIRFASLYLSEVCKVWLPWHSICLILEVLVLTELRKKREKDMKALNKGLIVGQLVDGDIEHSQNDPCIVAGVHIDVCSREAELLQRLLQL